MSSIFMYIVQFGINPDLGNNEGPFYKVLNWFET